MNAQELRIGNYVCNSISGYEFAINVDQIRRLYLNNRFSDIEPIPLTEEWLLKFGAEINPHNKSFFDIGPFTLTKLESGEFIIWHEGHALGKRLKYVHKLQNIFYELYDKELTCESKQINKSTNQQINKIE